MFSFALGLFAVIASVLSIAGLYGLTAYGVAQRTSEIGQRLAMGARGRQLAWLFLRSTLVHATVGLGIGGWCAGRWSIDRRNTFRISSADAMVLGGIVAALVAITVTACFIPARRAVRLDPVAALRLE